MTPMTLRRLLVTGQRSRSDSDDRKMGTKWLLKSWISTKPNLIQIFPVVRAHILVVDGRECNDHGHRRQLRKILWTQ